MTSSSTIAPTTSTSRTALRPVLVAGSFGGAVAVVLNLVLYLVGAAIAGGELLAVLPGATEAAPMPLVAVILMSFVPGPIAGLAYWGLSRLTRRPTAWLLGLAALAYLAFLPGPFNVASGVTILVLELMHIAAAGPILWFVLRARS